MENFKNQINILVQIDGTFLGDPTTAIVHQLKEKKGLEINCNLYCVSQFGKDLFKIRNGKLIETTIEEWKQFHDEKCNENFSRKILMYADLSFQD